MFRQLSVMKILAWISPLIGISTTFSLKVASNGKRLANDSVSEPLKTSIMLRTELDSASIFASQQKPSNPATQRLDHQRDLVWVETLDQCDATTLATFGSTYPDIRSCFIYGVQWDVDGTLRATGYYLFFKDGDFFDSVTLWVAYYNGDLCEKFDSCLFGTDSFPGLYAYDCSNVYCGPNAARTCTGEYTASMTCPPGETAASLPDIPFLRDVDCQRFLINNVQSNGIDDVCSICEYDADLNANVVSCDFGCSGCNDSGDCVAVENFFLFSETRFVRDISASTTVGDALSVLIRGPPQVDGFASLSVFNCLAFLNGSQCSCSVCGDRDGGTISNIFSVLVSVDCTNVDGVTFGSDCIDKDMWTGVYELIVSASNDCPDDQAPINAPVMAPINAPVMAPINAPVMAPINAPVMAPINAPVVAPINMPIPNMATSNVPVVSTPDDRAIPPTDGSAVPSTGASVVASLLMFAIVALFGY